MNSPAEVNARIQSLMHEKGMDFPELSALSGVPKGSMKNAFHYGYLLQVTSLWKIYIAFGLVVSVRMVNISSQTIVSRIQEVADRRGLSAVMLAEETNLPRDKFSSLYNHPRMPTPTTVAAVCDAVGITLEEFFSGRELDIEEYVPDRTLDDDTKNRIISELDEDFPVIHANPKGKCDKQRRDLIRKLKYSKTLHKYDNNKFKYNNFDS